MTKKGTLYLIPNSIGPAEASESFPSHNKVIAESLGYFVCEHAKTLRQLLKTLGIPSPYDHIQVFELNKHTDEYEIDQFLKPLKSGKDMGLVSDAGLPAVADPGAKIVEKAQALEAEVVPLIGPSSLMMALMSSGLNGQAFAFHGYLPYKKEALKKKLKELVSAAQKDGSAQIFIEAPYRNQSLLQAICGSLSPQIKLHISYGLQHEEAMLKTKTVGEWKKSKMRLEKTPAVFILGR